MLSMELYGERKLPNDLAICLIKYAMRYSLLPINIIFSFLERLSTCFHLGIIFTRVMFWVCVYWLFFLCV